MKQLDLDLVRSLQRLTQLKDAGWKFLPEGETGYYLAVKQDQVVVVEELGDLQECMEIEHTMSVGGVA
ncbi:hypothetical protein 278BB001_31 [Bacillus phage 278BB001]|nr:hypothetical protein 010DV004_40 [Bacillus phage 010DV004]QZA69257.1 hypothetical protein 010DV005_40 [Bacillus phage 010DV005]QZA69826.1 hypothetical protein 043JT007_40 [Bacillus phage 043JT007]QZA70182.1 hypothetical protein 278BB001_31 [Bacillus phage 278BB001]